MTSIDDRQTLRTGPSGGEESVGPGRWRHRHHRCRHLPTRAGQGHQDHLIHYPLQWRPPEQLPLARVTILQRFCNAVLVSAPKLCVHGDDRRHNRVKFREKWICKSWGQIC